MNYGNIKKNDIANGRGIRVSLFVSGCRHHCPGCFNPETWDFCYGEEFTDQTIAEIIAALSPDYVEGLTVLGGEPFEPENQPDLLKLLTQVKTTLPNKTVWCYSGYLFEELIGLAGSHAHLDITNEILNLTNILVDGKFIAHLKDISLKFRGSSNQRIIDVKKSLEKNKVILADDTII